MSENQVSGIPAQTQALGSRLNAQLWDVAPPRRSSSSSVDGARASGFRGPEARAVRPYNAKVSRRVTVRSLSVTRTLSRCNPGVVQAGAVRDVRRAGDDGWSHR